MKKILQKLNSIRLCMEAHPDNEPDSEFADRIEDLKELPQMIEDYTEEKTKNLELQIDVILSGSSHDLQQEYADKWISVKDALPEIDADVLVCLKNKHIFNMVYDGIQFYLIDGTETVSSVNNPVTHWMKLPEPPKED